MKMQYSLAKDREVRCKKCGKGKKRRGILTVIGDWITGPLEQLFYLMMTEE
jgi:hypothetical protein